MLHSCQKNIVEENSRLLDALIEKNFDSWKPVVEIFNKDSSLEHHTKCLFDANNFSNVLTNSEVSIKNI